MLIKWSWAELFISSRIYFSLLFIDTEHDVASVLYDLHSTFCIRNYFETKVFKLVGSLLPSVSSRKQPFADVLQNSCSLKFHNICRKITLLESLFNKSLQGCKFTKKILQHSCFPINIAKFMITSFFIEHLWWLLLSASFFEIFGFPLSSNS